MKKILSNICAWAALCMMGAAMLAGCSSDDNALDGSPVENPTTQTYHMTIQATKGMDTRALSYDGDTKTINATWKAGEKVYVYNDTKDEVLGGYLEAKTDGETVILEGELTGTVKEGDGLYLRFPQIDEDYTGQDGTLATIASKYDYAEGEAVVTYVTSSGNITAKDISGKSDIQFVNQQAIVKFTLLNKADNSAINATSLTIEAKEGSADRLMQKLDYAADEQTYGPIDITLSPATNEIYAALCPFYSDESYNYTLTATDADGETYTYTKEGVTFEWGKYYSITVKMNRQPRTYDLSQATSSVTLKNGDTATGTMPTGKVYIADRAAVTLRDVIVNSGISCNGDATINLEGANTVGGSGYSGITINPGTLTIQGSGSLTATGSDGGAGIGGDSKNCHVIIKSGTIVAQGSALGSTGAGIGGRGSAFGNITIEGGDVTATGGANAAGIGCGYEAGATTQCGDITISGGTVRATAGTITLDNHIISAIGMPATSVYSSSYSPIGTVTVTGGINSVTMTNSNAQGNAIFYFIHVSSLTIDSNSVNINGGVGDYNYGTVSSSWNSSTKTWTLTKKGS